MGVHFFKNKIRFTELTAFTRQFAAMAEAKLSLVRILDILFQQTENKMLKSILRRVKNDVEGGKTLTEAFSRYPDIFTDFYMNMIRVGEMTGQLDFMLNRVALYMEKINTLRRKLVQAMSYPALVVAVAVGAVSFLLTYVVPTFADMFRDFDAELPAITVTLMNISEFITQKLWLVAVIILSTVFGLRAYFKTSAGRRICDMLVMKIPIAGSILKKNYVSRFSRTLGILLESDISLLEALQVTEKSIPNVVVRQEISQMRFFAEKGEMLTHSLSRSNVFPPMVIQMLTVGEETAQLDRMLNRVADFYDEEIEAAITGLTSVLEPLIIVLLGIILGTILIALYMPLFDLVNIVPE